MSDISYHISFTPISDLFQKSSITPEYYFISYCSLLFSKLYNKEPNTIIDITSDNGKTTDGLWSYYMEQYMDEKNDFQTYIVTIAITKGEYEIDIQGHRTQILEKFIEILDLSLQSLTIVKK